MHKNEQGVLDAHFGLPFGLRSDGFEWQGCIKIWGVCVQLVWVCLHGTDYGLARQIVLLLRLARMRRVFTLIKVCAVLPSAAPPLPPVPPSPPPSTCFFPPVFRPSQGKGNELVSWIC